MSALCQRTCVTSLFARDEYRRAAVPPQDCLKIKTDTTEWNIALRKATANKARVDDRTGLRTAVERDVDA